TGDPAEPGPRHRRLLAPAHVVPARTPGQGNGQYGDTTQTNPTLNFHCHCSMVTEMMAHTITRSELGKGFRTASSREQTKQMVQPLAFTRDSTSRNAGWRADPSHSNMAISLLTMLPPPASQRCKAAARSLSRRDPMQ